MSSVALQDIRHVVKLTAVRSASTTFSTALAAFLADETTTQNCQAGSQASAILLLGCLLHGRRSLLVTHLHIASVYCSCLHQVRGILVVEGDSTVPAGARIVEGGRRIVGLVEGRSSYNAVSGYEERLLYARLTPAGAAEGSSWTC